MKRKFVVLLLFLFILICNSICVLAYTNHCWNCQSTVSSNDCRQCEVCGWYICNTCGACNYNCERYKTNMKYITDSDGMANYIIDKNERETNQTADEVLDNIRKDNEFKRQYDYYMNSQNQDDTTYQTDDSDSSFNHDIDVLDVVALISIPTALYLIYLLVRNK